MAYGNVYGHFDSYINPNDFTSKVSADDEIYVHHVYFHALDSILIVIMVYFDTVNLIILLCALPFM